MRRLSRAVAGVLVLLSVMPEVGSAADAAQARELAREYLEAVRAEGFAAESRYMHPEELARFQHMLIPVFEADQAAGRRVLLNATFGRDAAVLNARMAEPEEFMRRFARVMAVRMPDQHVGFDELEVLGTVEEGEWMHVLVRLRTVSEIASIDELTVVSLLPDGDTWKLALNPKLEAAARSMDRSGQERRPPPRLVPRYLTSEPSSPQADGARPAQ